MTKDIPTFVKGCGGIAASFSPFIGGAVDAFTQYYTTEDGKVSHYFSLYDRYKLMKDIQFDSGFYIKDDLLFMQVSTSLEKRGTKRANKHSIRLRW